VASHVNLISSPDDRLVCQLARRCGHCNCVRTRRLSCSWSELASCTDGSAMGTVEVGSNPVAAQVAVHGGAHDTTVSLGTIAFQAA
jgi:hypothetical protein